MDRTRKLLGALAAAVIVFAIVEVERRSQPARQAAALEQEQHLALQADLDVVSGRSPRVDLSSLSAATERVARQGQLPALESALQHPDPYHVEHALKGIEALGPEALWLAPSVLPLLEKEDRMASQALVTLAAMGEGVSGRARAWASQAGPQGRRWAKSLLSQLEADRRYRAEQDAKIARFQAKADAEARTLVALLYRGDPAALAMMGGLGPKALSALPVLKHRIKQGWADDFDVACLQQLRGVDPTDSQGVLAEALNSTDYSLYETAARQLGQMGPPGFKVLRRALDHPLPDVRKEAHRTLQELDLDYRRAHPYPKGG